MLNKTCHLKALFILFCFIAVHSLGTPRAFAGNLFSPYVTFPTGSCPEAVAIGDVNNDGLNDVVVSTVFNDDPVNDHHIHVFLQQPNGELAFSAKYPVPGAFYAYHPKSVDIGDLNNDGRGDVVVSANNAIGIFLQNDGGTLDPMITYATNHSSGTNSYKVRIGDFNNDGLLDVVSIDWGTQSYDVDVFLQNASGTMDPPVVYVVQHGGYDDLAVGDVNNDGLQDIIVMSGQGYANDTLGILLQNSEGTMDEPVYYDLTENVNTNGVAVGDINADGLQDVAVTYNYNIGVFYQNASGTLDASVSYPSSGDTKPVDIGDVNLDGKADVVSAGGSSLEVHLQGPSGELLPYEIYTIPYETHYPPHALEIGDVNNDGANDVVLANCGSGLVVLYGQTELPVLLDLKVNGSDGPVSVKRNEIVDVTMSLDPGSSLGVPFDWWVGAFTPYGMYWLNSSQDWVRSSIPISMGTYGLYTMVPTSVLSRTLPPGAYRFFFVLDGQANGLPDEITYRDTVDVRSKLF